MEKLILTGFFLSVLFGCANTTKPFSEIDVTSKFYDKKIGPDTYLLALNRFHEDDPSFRYFSYGPSQECASSITHKLNSLGYKRVYHQLNAKYIITLNCSYSVISFDDGYKVTANHVPDIKTSNSTVTSSNALESLQVRSTELGSRVNSFDITKSKSTIINRHASVDVYENIESFNHRDRRLLWHGMASSYTSSSESDRKSTNEEELIDALFESFVLKENVGDFYGFEEKKVKHPWYQPESNTSSGVFDWSKPFLYTLGIENSNRMSISPFDSFVYKPWMTVYRKGEKVRFSAKDGYKFSTIATVTTLNNSEGTTVRLEAACVDSKPYFYLFSDGKKINFFENGDDVYIYDSLDGIKLNPSNF